MDLGGNLSWDDVWYGHEAGFGNVTVCGSALPNGVRQFYDAAGCPAR